MRLTGSFQTMVTHGTSAAVTSSTSTSCSVSGALLVTPPVSHGGRPCLGRAVVRRRIRRPIRRRRQAPYPGRMSPAASTALLTDKYELTMLGAALADGTAERRCTFEVFGRRLPSGRRYGVVAGIGRVLDAVERFTFGEDELAAVEADLDARTLEFLRDYRFDGDIDGYPEGELYFPNSPLLSVRGTFASAVILETLILSILNYDCAVASAASRMVSAAG